MPPALQVTTSGPRYPACGPVRDRGHHQPRVRGRQALVVEAAARHLARVHVVHQEVRARREALEDLAPARAGEIEGDAALVGVEIEKEAALLGMGDVARKGAARAGRIALPGRLDLDHRRAEIRE